MQKSQSIAAYSSTYGSDFDFFRTVNLVSPYNDKHNDKSMHSHNPKAGGGKDTHSLKTMGRPSMGHEFYATHVARHLNSTTHLVSVEEVQHFFCPY